MLTLTKTLLDIADCNITLHYLGDAAADDPLAFSSAESYNALYERIAARRTPYETIRGVAGEALEQLRGAWSPNKFWARYLEGSTRDTYPSQAWENAVPIVASLTERVEVVLPDGLDLKVSPVPSVLLYPCGWSTWISFQITGDHTLDELAALMAHLTEGEAYQLADDVLGNRMTLMQYLGRVGRGVQSDAYGGKKVAVFNPQDTLAVTTVVGKHGGSLSSGAIEEQETALKKIVRSAGRKPVTELIAALPRGDIELLNFVVHDGLSWFLWAEHRLNPQEREAQQLSCYHTNTFRSLQHAWLLQKLLERALRTKAWSASLTDLVTNATNLLGNPVYKNFSMLAFLGRGEHVKTRAAAEKRLQPPH